MAEWPLELFSKVREYINFSRDIQERLKKHPDDWQKYQPEFNAVLDRISLEIMRFELDNLPDNEAKVYRLKRIFGQRYRKYFLRGDFIRWSFEKPFGYAGDFKIIDAIYQNQPVTRGFDRLWDSYFQQLDIVQSVRVRKEDLKKIIFAFVKKNQGRELRVMNLGSGPAREIKELLEENPQVFERVIFDCYDFDQNALNYAKSLLNNPANVNFIQENAVRLALTKRIKEKIPFQYDLIYSTGLFDYFGERVAGKLVSNLLNITKKRGTIVITNVSDKKYNRSAAWMEWVADWYLVYRTKDEFKKIFSNTGVLLEYCQIFPQAGKLIWYGILNKVMYN